MTTAEYISSIAQQSGVTYQPTPLDAFADQVTRLSDDEVRKDPISDLLVELKRRGVISGPQMVELLCAHLNEVKHV